MGWRSPSEAGSEGGRQRTDEDYLNLAGYSFGEKIDGATNINQHHQNYFKQENEND